MINDISVYILYIVMSIITKHGLAKDTECSTIVGTGKMVEIEAITLNSLPRSLPIASICAPGPTVGDGDDSFCLGRLASLLDPGRATGLTNSTIIPTRIGWWLDRQGYSSRLYKAVPPWPH